VPDFFGDWTTYADYVAFLLKSNSIVEPTQLWWSIRPHPGFGTVEVRIMDAQSRGDESTAIAALATGCVVQAAMDYDADLRPADIPARLIEENMWRAIRHGLDGKQIDLTTGSEVAAREAVEQLLDWIGPAREETKLDAHLGALTATLEAGNGAQRQWRANETGDDMRDVFASAVVETRTSYAGVAAPAGERQEVAP
jgi:glutamate---cysteine ligase / carboxylate-amine ligase